MGGLRCFGSISAAAIVGMIVSLSVCAQAEEIAVGNYGVSANGMPFSVALEKKFEPNCMLKGGKMVL